MSISSFAPKDPPQPLNNVIKHLFQTRAHKKIPVDRSDFDNLTSLQLNPLRKEYAQISQRSTYLGENEKEDKILVYHTPKVESEIKKKMIHKVKGH